MRKFLKKAVTAVASMAMLAGLVAGMPAMEAKAGSLIATKNIYVSVEGSDVKRVGINIYNGADFGDAAKMSDITGKGHLTEMNEVQTGLYKLTGDIYDDFLSGTNGGLQVEVFGETDNSLGEYKTDTYADDKGVHWDDVKTAIMDPDTIDIWLVLDKDNSWTVGIGDEVEITATDAEIAAAAEAKIDTAIALEATKANKSAYDTAKSAYDALTDEQKALVDGNKVTALTDGIAAIQAIIDAENAAASGTLTIYVTAEDGWDVMNVYGWEGAEFGAWPGKATTSCEKNEGWFSLSFNITQATNLIFNNGTDQTVDITGVSAGTYWYVIKSKGDNDKCDFEVSENAPEGWVEEEAAVIEVEEPVTEDNNASDDNNVTEDNNAQEGNGGATAPTTADTTPVAVAVVAVLALGLGVVVLNSKKANR